MSSKKETEKILNETNEKYEAITEALKSRILDMEKLQYCNNEQLEKLTAFDKQELNTLFFEIYNVLLSQHEAIVRLTNIISNEAIDFNKRIKETCKLNKDFGGLYS